MLLFAKHETNAGGACSIRDAQGQREQENIAILRSKYPGAFYDHPTRPNQVVLKWGGHLKYLGKHDAAAERRTQSGAGGVPRPNRPLRVLSQREREALAKLVQCTGETTVEFDFHAKTAESNPKSYQRYQAYAVAKSFQEALDKGASTADIEHDIRVGCLRITGNTGGTPQGRWCGLVAKWQGMLAAATPAGDARPQEGSTPAAKHANAATADSPQKSAKKGKNAAAAAAAPAAQEAATPKEAAVRKWQAMFARGMEQAAKPSTKARKRPAPSASGAGEAPSAGGAGEAPTKKVKKCEDSEKMRAAAAQLLLVTDGTVIAFTPGAKHEGNFKKSYHRYEAYSKATSLQQALDLGAWPGDLLFDFERGFWRVVGGTMRERPMASVVEAKSRVEQMVFRWSQRIAPPAAAQ